MLTCRRLLFLLVFYDYSLGRDSTLLNLVNSLIGNAGGSADGSGGMIPSVSPPFGMTRWVAQTHPNIVSRTPYNVSDNNIIHGFMGTHQPAIWMGETAPVFVVPGIADEKLPSQITAKFKERGMKKKPDTEKISVGSYAVGLDLGKGEVDVLMSASSRIGYLSFNFSRLHPDVLPHLIVQASRPTSFYIVPSPSVYGTTIPYFPIGNVTIDAKEREICGWSSERQDSVITPVSTAEATAEFKGYFCAKFSVPFVSFGTITGSQGTVQGLYATEGSDGPDEVVEEGATSGEGSTLSAFARFAWPPTSSPNLKVDVRVSTSFISIDQARKTLRQAANIRDTITETEDAWLEKIGRIHIEGSASKANETVFLTGVFHALQYPYEQSEDGKYRSAHDNQVHDGESYTGYSIWDTYRAEWAFLLIFAPERIPAMIQSMLQDYQQSGWLPMWKNFAETNIMVGTHADSLIAEAVLKGFREGFDLNLAWEAIWKDCTVAPVNDTKTSYYDRQPDVDYEVRAGLDSVYTQNGWVADDIHSESASRTLAYAYDDYAAYKLAEALNKPWNITSFLRNRAHAAPFTIYNTATGFMEARNADGTWAGETKGWTEGDKWAYSFDVVHDIPTLIELRGGNASFVKSLDEHFDGGHNLHSNEPSHHIPYLYALAGAPYKTQEKVRQIASSDYNDTAWGLAGNEDCGQMSAWYVFSAMGFYPVNPVSGEYVVGSPFFDKLTILLPPKPYATPKSGSPYYDKTAKAYKLTINAPGALKNQYVKSLKVNGRAVNWPVIKHEDIFVEGGELSFEMSDKQTSWGTGEDQDGWRIEL